MHRLFTDRVRANTSEKNRWYITELLYNPGGNLCGFKWSLLKEKALLVENDNLIDTDISQLYEDWGLDFKLEAV